MRELNRDTPCQNQTIVMFLRVVFFTLQRREVHSKEGKLNKGTSSHIFTPITLQRWDGKRRGKGRNGEGKIRKGRGAPTVGSHPDVRNPEKYLGYQLSKSIGLI